MFQLFSTPEWFNGIDIIFDCISLVVALLIAGFSWKVYRRSSETKFGYFSFAFFLVSLGFLSKIAVHGLNYYDSFRFVATKALLPVVGHSGVGVNYSDLFFRVGFFAHMLTLLGAWLLIYFISQKGRERLKKFDETTQIFLFIYFIGLISVVSNLKYTVFYLTAVVILSLIVLNYYKNYLNKGTSASLLVMVSFLLILASQVLFVFVFLNTNFYVGGEMLQLLGFLLLLYTYVKIVRK